MKKMWMSKELGGTLIITGTSIGAGMLSIPIVTASGGFLIAVVLLVATWFLMMRTALLIAEVNLHYPDGTNFSRMAYLTLGVPGQSICWLAYLLLLYSLSAAYTSGGSTLFAMLMSKLFHVHLSYALNALIFVLIFGIIVYLGTRVVDHVNKVLLIVKFLAFFIMVVLVMPNISWVHLSHVGAGDSGSAWLLPLLALPILATSFGFHHIIPTIRTYLNSDPKALKRAIIWGSFIPLVIYLLWTWITLGVVPMQGSNGYGVIGDSLARFVTALNHYAHSPKVSFMIDLFTDVAVTTSFLGVTLGLYNFNQDTYHLSIKKHGARILAFIITFLPAWLYAVYYPDGFKQALGYASIFVAILLICLPALMAWSVRRQKGQSLSVSVKLYLGFVFIMGLVVMVLQGLAWHY